MCFYIISRDTDIDTKILSEYIYLFSNGKSWVESRALLCPRGDLKSIDILYPNEYVEEVIDLSEKFQESPPDTFLDEEGRPKGNLKKFDILEPFKGYSAYENILGGIGESGFKYYNIRFEEEIGGGEKVIIPLRFVSPKASRPIDRETEKEIDFTATGPSNVKEIFEDGMEKMSEEVKDSFMPTNGMSHAYDKISEITKQGFQKNNNIHTFKLGLVFEPGMSGPPCHINDIERVPTLRTPTEKWPMGGKGELREFKYDIEGEEVSSLNFKVNGKANQEKKVKIFVTTYILPLIYAIIVTVIGLIFYQYYFT